MSRRKTSDGCGKALDLWQAPGNAGDPLICIATTFTFDATFFETECIGRFLQMDAHPSESESVAYLIEREEKLAGARVHALVDRRHARDKESLRWDVIGVLVPQAVQHAKLSLLAWANHVRLIIGSGNLTETGYRKNVEVFGALDLSRADGGNKAAIHTTLEFLQELAALGIGTDAADNPKGRLRESLQRVRHHIRNWPARDGSDAVPVFNSPNRSVVEQLRELWPSNSPAREAYVVSPFFDHVPNDARAAEALQTLLAQRGDRASYFYVKTEPLPDGRTRLYAPKGIVDTLRKNGHVEVTPLTSEQNGELREVHSKLLSLGNDTWRLLLVGSSNFTSAGLGTREGKGNCEANLLYRVKKNDPLFRRLDDIWPEAREESLDVDSDLLIWEPAFEDGEDGGVDVLLPAAFQEALFVPGDAPKLLLTLGVNLPAKWSINVPAGRPVLDSSEAGNGTHIREWRDQPVPFVLEVSWEHAGATAVASWPVNVSNPAALPPPDAFRDLSLDELLEILGSGFIVHPDGLVVTACHVLDRPNGIEQKVTVRLNDGRESAASLVRAHRSLDFALLWLDSSDKYPVLTIGEPHKLRYAETVLAVGHPGVGDMALTNTVSTGVVANPNCPQRGVEWIQMTTDIDPGNSGGPLVNRRGEVIGINCWKYTTVAAAKMALPLDYLEEDVAMAAQRGRDGHRTGRTCSICGSFESETDWFCPTCGAAYTVS